MILGCSSTPAATRSVCTLPRPRCRPSGRRGTPSTTPRRNGAALRTAASPAGGWTTTPTVSSTTSSCATVRLQARAGADARRSWHLFRVRARDAGAEGWHHRPAHHRPARPVLVGTFTPLPRVGTQAEGKLTMNDTPTVSHLKAEYAEAEAAW